MYAECRHIMPSGCRCHSPALRGRFYCYFHDKLHTYTQDGTRDDSSPLRLPSIEDARGIQLALMQIMGSLASGRLCRENAGTLLYGAQIALQALSHIPSTPPMEIVNDPLCDGTGIDVACCEEKSEPYTDCSTCDRRHGCTNVARENKKSVRAVCDEGRDRRERAEREPLALPASNTPASALPVPAPGAALATSSSFHFDPQKEAALEARINKFRPNKREAERIARNRELDLLRAAEEITADEFDELMDHPELPLPSSPRRKNKKE